MEQRRYSSDLTKLASIKVYKNFELKKKEKG